MRNWEMHEHTTIPEIKTVLPMHIANSDVWGDVPHLYKGNIERTLPEMYGENIVRNNIKKP